MRAMRATIYMKATVALNGLNRLLVKTTLPEEVAIKRTLTRMIAYYIWMLEILMKILTMFYEVLRTYVILT